MSARCEYFKKTGIKCSPDKECFLCPLREEKTGDCLRDIEDDAGKTVGEMVAPRQSEIWRLFYEQRRAD